MTARATGPTNELLTTSPADLPPNRLTRLWLIEIDLEHGRVQQAGEGNVTPRTTGDGEAFIESQDTGGCYSGPSIVGRVELHSAGEHRLALFPTEQALHAGARELVDGFGDALPVGIQRWLSAL